MSVLVLSLATSGYQWQYRRNIQTHKTYAERHGYQYSVVDQLQVTKLGGEIAWLKLFLIRDALLAGYTWVFFVDADAMIRPSTPRVETLVQPNKFIYLAKGYSGRYNSGVMLLRNSVHSRDYIAQVLASSHLRVPEEDAVGWGENGHIIWYAKNNPYVKTIGVEWNNNRDPKMDDYIRHFSAGPLRKNYRASFFDFVRFKVVNMINRAYLLFVKPLSPSEKNQYLESIACAFSK